MKFRQWGESEGNSALTIGSAMTAPVCIVSEILACYGVG